MNILEPVPTSTPIVKSANAELLAAIIRKHFDLIKDPRGCDGAQMWEGQWWMPLRGCDTLSDMFDDIVYAIDHKQANLIEK